MCDACANRFTLTRSTPAAPALRSTCAHPKLNVSRRDTLSIKLCHLPPLTPVCRAANIAFVQIGAGANFRCTQLPSTLASRLVVSDTIDASTFIYLLFSGLWLSTFLPHFPSAPFALTHVSTTFLPCAVLLGL